MIKARHLDILLELTMIACSILFGLAAWVTPDVHTIGVAVCAMGVLYAVYAYALLVRLTTLLTVLRRLSWGCTGVVDVPTQVAIHNYAVHSSSLGAFVHLTACVMPVVMGCMAISKGVVPGGAALIVLGMLSQVLNEWCLSTGRSIRLAILEDALDARPRLPRQQDCPGLGEDGGDEQ